MRKRIEISKGFEEDRLLDEEAFLKLSDEERFIVVCELSELMLHIQYENDVLPKDNNFSLQK